MGAEPAFAAQIAHSYARPEPLQRHTFRAYHESGAELDAASARDLAEAVGLALIGCQHKSCFSVVEVDTFERRAVQHHYRVKKSTRNGSHRRAYDGNYPVFEGNLEAEFIYMQRITAFAPVAPWQWTQADPTGFKHGQLPANSPLLDAGQ